MVRWYSFLSVLLFLCASTRMSAAADSASWVQQANTGPLTPKAAQWVRYELDSVRLKITCVVDSTGPANYIYMVLTLPKYKGIGSYTLNGQTIYQYGNRADQKTVCDVGSCSIDAIDPNTNVVTGSFSWTGRANLQSGITLTQKITDGRFKIAIKPDIVMVPKPGEGARFKRDKDVSIKIYARDKFDLNRFLPGVEITFTHDGIVFENAKTLKATTDATGAATFALKTRKEVLEGDYSYKVKGTKSGVNDSPELTVGFKIDPSDQYYYTKCAGVPNVEFDAGDGNKWEEDGGTSITATGTDIRLAGLIKLSGTVTIDTSGGQARVSGNGDVYFESVFLDGVLQPFYLYRGPITFFVPPCEAGIDFLTSDLASRLSGGKLKSAKLVFLGDGVKSYGAKLTCGMELGENAKEGCNDELPFGTVWKPNKNAELELEGSFIVNGSTTDFTIAGTVKNFSPVASWCVKEAKAEYKSASSEFSISGKGKSPLFSEISAGVTFRDGTLNAFKVDFELEKCIPIPDVPTVCWKGGGLEIENLFIGNPIKGSINAKFGPTPPLDNLYLVTVKGGFEDPPAKVYGEVTGNMIKVAGISEEKPYQAEIVGTATLEFSTYKGTFDVTAKFLHFGADYFYTGKTVFALGFKPLSVLGSFDGSLVFPALSSDNAKALGLFGKFLNGYAPITLGKAGGSLSLQEGGPNTATISYDLRGVVPPTQESAEVYAALRELAHGTMTVDLDQLPSPAAIEFDGGFKNLLSGWFSSVNGKSGEQVQAADVTFTVQEGQPALVAWIESSTKSLPSSLKDPDGTVYTQGDTANGVHRIYSADKNMTLWVIGEPKAGTWTLSAPSASTTDTFAIQTTVPVPTIEFSSSLSGNTLTVTWTGTDLPSDGDIAFYLDETDANNDGVKVGSAKVNVGSFSVALTDSTAPCKFRVMGVLTHPTASLIAHASTQHTNPAMSLAPPENAQAVSDQNGNVTVTWSPVLDGRVKAVVVYDAITDTLVAGAYNFETQASVTLANHSGRGLTLRTVDKRGRVSCPTEAISITTDVDEEQPGQEFFKDGISVKVHPHPISESSNVTVQGLQDGNVSIFLYDITGQVVLESTGLVADQGVVHMTISAQQLTSGTYVMSIRQGGRAVTHGLIVSH